MYKPFTIGWWLALYRICQSRSIRTEYKWLHYCMEEGNKPTDIKATELSREMYNFLYKAKWIEDRIETKYKKFDEYT